jgi:hypothetical protein
VLCGPKASLEANRQDVVNVQQEERLERHVLGKLRAKAKEDRHNQAAIGHEQLF